MWLGRQIALCVFDQDRSPSPPEAVTNGHLVESFCVVTQHMSFPLVSALQEGLIASDHD